MPIYLALGDITDFEADAIVNAANSLLVIGGGVCGAIHRKGGHSIVEESALWVEERGPVEPGGAAITGAGNLPARHVIHAVGPMWHGGGTGEAEQLAKAYRSAIRLADEHGLSSIAFPSLSTGIFGYPTDLAAPVAVRAVRDALREADSVNLVTFVLFDQETYDIYKRALDSLYDEST